MSKEVIVNEVEQVEVVETETTVANDTVSETTDVVADKGEVIDIDKAVQSARSKAKNEILEEIGIKSVADIKAQIEKGKGYDELVGKFEEVNKQLEDVIAERDGLTQRVKKTEDRLLINELGVSDEFADDFIKLVDLDNSGKDRLEVANELKLRFSSGNIFKGVETQDKPVKIGNEKTGDNQPTLKDRIKELTKL